MSQEDSTDDTEPPTDDGASVEGAQTEDEVQVENEGSAERVPTDESEQAATEERNAPERPIDSVLLNALAEVTSDDAREVIADDSSTELLGDVLSAVATQEEQMAFADAVATVHTPGATDEGARRSVATVVDGVREEFADRNVWVEVDHRATLSLNRHEAAIYSFIRTRDPTTLSEIEVPETVAESVEEGAGLVADGAFERAATAFERAVDAADGSNGSVLARSLAAWANHWAGADDAAIDFVEEALHLHANAWTPMLAGYSADPDAAFAQPEQFREGKYAAMALLRYTVDLPETASITPSLGFPGEDETVEQWRSLDGTSEFAPIPRLATETVLRLQLRGQVPAFPAMHSYYVALGIADTAVKEVREVYRLLLDGPAGETVSETIRFETTD